MVHYWQIGFSDISVDIIFVLSRTLVVPGHGLYYSLPYICKK